MGILIGVLFIFFMLWLGFKITGAILLAAFWLFIKIPFALILFLLGIICCCTILLIPVGLLLFKGGISFIVPGSLI